MGNMSKVYTQLEREAIDRIVSLLYSNDLVLSKRRRNKYGRVVLDKMARGELEEAILDIYGTCKKVG